METKELLAALQEAFARLVEADEVDIEVDPEAGGVEVAAEAWTLHLEGWPDRPLAWLAIDEEPEDAGQLGEARHAAMSSEALAALRRGDATLNGGIKAALAASDDPLSLDLAAALTTGSPGDPAP